MKIHNKEIINTLDEKFVAVDTKTADSKNRINLGEKIFRFLPSKTKVDAYKIFVGVEGDILLRPVVNIPSKEAWVYQNPNVLKQIRQGLAEAKQGKSEKVKNLDKFLEDL